MFLLPGPYATHGAGIFTILHDWVILLGQMSGFPADFPSNEYWETRDTWKNIANISVPFGKVETNLLRDPIYAISIHELYIDLNSLLIPLSLSSKPHFHEMTQTSRVCKIQLSLITKSEFKQAFHH